MFGARVATNGAAKPSGMDMMVQSILRGMGVSPDALTSYIEQGKQLAVQFVSAMQSTEKRLAAIELRQKEQGDLLEHLSRRLETELDTWPKKLKIP